jgi:hypothetical protein
MKLRLALVVMALLLALAGADSATAASAGPEAAAAAKKCKKPKARYNGRCVRRCPAGYVKKANRRWGRKCVRRATGNPAPDNPAPPQPLFERPNGELTGQDAFNHFSRYFLNSRFTDCPAGWPNCAVEERYDHCPDATFVYHRYTPSSGSDINTYSDYTVTGAVAHQDGSWGVEYTENRFGNFYSWDVLADGTVNGRYWSGSNRPPNPPNQLLGPLRWKQPTDCGA